MQTILNYTSVPQHYTAQQLIRFKHISLCLKDFSGKEGLYEVSERQYFDVVELVLREPQ
jgi:hypothetical protein